MIWRRHTAPVRRSIATGGDIAHATNALLIQITVVPAEVLVIHCQFAQTLASLAYELGGRHCPLEVADYSIFIPADDPIETMLIRPAITYEKAVREFQPIDCPG